MGILTSKEFLEKSYIDITDTDIHGFHHDSNIEFLLREFAKLHVEKCKKELSELVEERLKDEAQIKAFLIDGSSILKAYPLTNIK